MCKEDWPTIGLGPGQPPVPCIWLQDRMGRVKVAGLCVTASCYTMCPGAKYRHGMPVLCHVGPLTGLGKGHERNFC